MGAPLTVVAPGVALACSVLATLEGGEGSIEFVRSCTAGCGFADAARGGLLGRSDQGVHWQVVRDTYTDSAFTPSGRSVVI